MNECVGAPTNKRDALVDKTTKYERRGRVCVYIRVYRCTGWAYTRQRIGKDESRYVVRRAFNKVYTSSRHDGNPE
jgi:hypothetical protein